MKKDTRKRLITYFFMFLLAIYILAPLVWILMMSFKSKADVIAVPPKFIFTPTLDNYKALIGVAGGETLVTGSAFLSYFKNSLILSVSSVLLALVLGLPAAYAIARLRFKVKEALAFTYLSFRFVPEITIILPLYVIYQRLGLYNTYLGLILVYQLIALPLMIWMMRSYFEEIPIAVEQAAQTDGYSWFASFRKIILPLVAPGMAAALVLAFIFCWNNFVFGLMLGGNSTQPVTVGLLSFMGTNEVQWGLMAAATIVAVLPLFILALLVQRYMIRGLTFGAVK
ncbi:MAG: carbohydrate ABC transporter permease [Anaerolineales bacterium]|jgi:multiple sugar transport system permease protein